MVGLLEFGKGLRGAHASTTTAPGFVGRLDLEFGQITPVVSGLNSPHGLALVKMGDENESSRDESKEACKAAFPNL